MAGTVIEYLKKYGDIPFREKPLNDVDSLALCQLSYLKFDGMVSDVRHNGPSVTLAGDRQTTGCGEAVRRCAF